MKHEMSRREFVTTTAVACACLLYPPSLALAESKEPVEIGTLKDYGQDGVTDKWARSHGFFVVRREGRLYATSSICTHHRSGHLVSQLGAGQFACPQHGSTFSFSGTVQRGPARRSLPRLGIRINDQGILAVDPTKQFEEGKWNEPGSFVEVK